MVYEIQNDGFRFQGFYLDPYEIVNFFPEEIELDDIIQFYAKDLQLAPFWRELKAEFQPIEGLPIGSIPDICTWIGSSLVFSKRAYDVFYDHLKGCGEFLPISCSGQEFYLFNCLAHGVLDEINSKPEIIGDSGEVLQPEVVRFNEVAIRDKPLFKTLLNNCSVVYCGDVFKSIYSSADLTGVSFEPLF